MIIILQTLIPEVRLLLSIPECLLVVLLSALGGRYYFRLYLSHFEDLCIKI